MKIIRYAPLLAGIMISGQALAEPTLGAAPQATAEAAAVPEITDSVATRPAQAPLVLLSADEMDRVTAGVGRDNVGDEAWTALLDAGFSLHHNLNSDQGVIDQAGHVGVAVPSTVPNSFCVAFC